MEFEKIVKIMKEWEKNKVVEVGSVGRIVGYRSFFRYFLEFLNALVDC